MPDCNHCGKSLEWGMEHQLDYGTDSDCLCSDCNHDREVSD